MKAEIGGSISDFLFGKSKKSADSDSLFSMFDAPKPSAVVKSQTNIQDIIAQEFKKQQERIKREEEEDSTKKNKKNKKSSKPKMVEPEDDEDDDDDEDDEDLDLEELRKYMNEEEEGNSLIISKFLISYQRILKH